MAAQKIDAESLARLLADGGSQRAAARALGIHHSTVAAFVRHHPEVLARAERLTKDRAKAQRKRQRLRDRRALARQGMPIQTAAMAPEKAIGVPPVEAREIDPERLAAIRRSVSDTRPGNPIDSRSAGAHRTRGGYRESTRVRVLVMDGGASQRYRDLLDEHDRARACIELRRRDERGVEIDHGVFPRSEAQVYLDAGWEVCR